MNTLNEIKQGFGLYMGEYFRQLMPTHAAIMDMRQRGLNKSIILAPDRMIDALNEQLAYYREHSNKVAMAQAQLPVILVAMSKDAIPSMADFAVQPASPRFVCFPSDERRRVFKLQTAIMERRVQLAFLGSEEGSVRSLAAQFILFSARPEYRRMNATYHLIQGVVEPFPVNLETSENPAANVKLDQDNLTALTIDLTLKETVPFLITPESERGEFGPDSDGYNVVQGVTLNDRTANVYEHITAKTQGHDRVRQTGMNEGMDTTHNKDNQP